MTNENDSEVDYRRNEIADKLNFLVDKEGRNVYKELKDTRLKAEGYNVIGKAKRYNQYAVKLIDEKTKENYYINVHTDKNVTSIRAEWKNKKTGNQWLDEDMKAVYMQNNPEKKLKKLEEPAFTEINYKQIELAPRKKL